jgi:hypothetical protein
MEISEKAKHLNALDLAKKPTGCAINALSSAERKKQSSTRQFSRNESR